MFANATLSMESIHIRQNVYRKSSPTQQFKWKILPIQYFLFKIFTNAKFYMESFNTNNYSYSITTSIDIYFSKHFDNHELISFYRATSLSQTDKVVSITSVFNLAKSFFVAFIF